MAWRCRPHPVLPRRTWFSRRVLLPHCSVFTGVQWGKGYPVPNPLPRCRWQTNPLAQIPGPGILGGTTSHPVGLEAGETSGLQGGEDRLRGPCGPLALFPNSEALTSAPRVGWSHSLSSPSSGSQRRLHLHPDRLLPATSARRPPPTQRPRASTCRALESAGLHTLLAAITVLGHPGRHLIPTE